MEGNQSLKEFVEIEGGNDVVQAQSAQQFSVVCDLSIRRAEELISLFPTTRYYGSKKRLLHWLFENLKDVPFRTVLDGFGGTASVSLLLKSMGKDVTYNDALVSNGVTAKVLLANEVSVSRSDVEQFFQDVSPAEGFIAKTFSAKFYLDEENRWLDGACERIQGAMEPEKNVYLYCLFQACLQKRPFNLFHRANLNLRTGGAKQSFGNQTTWDTPFITLILRAYDELIRAVRPSGAQQIILPPTDVSEIEVGYDLVYLDPPYISPKKEGDDYLRRYHFLEGLCRYDEWQGLIDRDYRNLQFQRQPHISEWQEKRSFRDRLYGLIGKHRHSIVALSYVDNAFPTRAEIESFFSETFANVDVKQKGLPHALSKGAKNELLFIGIPR